MFLAEREKNRRKAFEYFVEKIKKQNKDTIVFGNEIYQFTTKRGKVYKYLPVSSIEKAIEDYSNSKIERCNGFVFVLVNENWFKEESILTIVEKVIKLLTNYGQMSLFEIYDALPEHTEASIRGNINRYISKKGKEALIKRVDKGIYSVVEIISVEEKGDKKYISYQNTFFTDNGKNELCVLHKDFEVPADSEIEVGCYQRNHIFVSYDDLQNHLESVKAIFYNGDAVELMKRIPDETFDFCITDPPYRTISGGNGGKNSPKGMLSKNDGKIFEFNDCNPKEWIPQLFRVMKNGTHTYIFSNLINLWEFHDIATKAGFKVHNLLSWEKNNANCSRWYMPNSEFVLFLYKGKAKAINNCGSKRIHHFDNILGNKTHPTEKPLDLIKFYMENSSNEGDFGFDPFAGSFSLAKAGLMLNRKTLSAEIDTNYYYFHKNQILNSI